MAKVVLELSRWGNSQGVRLPKELLENVNVHLDDFKSPNQVQFEVTVHDGSICLKPQMKVAGKQPTKLSRRLSAFGYTEETFQDDFSWNDVPVGKEEW